MTKKYFIRTFGCQMNVHDSGKIAGILEGLSFVKTDDMRSADIILFNTCTVREHAHHKAISEIGRAMQMKKRRPGLIVGVCGCVAQAERENLFRIYPELDIVVGPDQIHTLKLQIPNYKFQINSKFQTANSKICATELIDNPEEYNWKYLLESPLITHSPSPITAFVTIMKGCNNRCTFCIVPCVRGEEVSRPEGDIIEEINKLVLAGVKEVTLLGQNVNSYFPTSYSSPSRGEGEGGGENKCSHFVRLIRRISSGTDIQRIRYTSPHPKDLGGDLMEEHAVNPKLCAHMHLPLQAGSSRILKLMKRTYNREQFVKKALRLRGTAPSIEITTDIIVGFPTETEADFTETLDVVKEISFDGMFAFKYSPRPGTKSAGMKDDVEKKEKDERLQRLLELNAKIWKERTSRLVGTVQEVLVEGVSRKNVTALPTHQRTNASRRLVRLWRKPTHQLTGRTFASKIVNFAGNLNLVGHIVPVNITFAGSNSLRGKLCNL